MMGRQRRKQFGRMLPVFLLVTLLLTACQKRVSSTLVIGCNPQLRPAIKVLSASQESSQLVYASNGPNVYAFDAGNGALRWCKRLSSDEFSSVSSDGKTIYADTYQTQMLAFQAQSGAVLWENSFGPFAGTPALPLTVADALVYGGTFEIDALDTQNGRLHWRSSLPSHTAVALAPAVLDGTAYFEINGQLNQILAFDAATGKERWTFPLRYGETGGIEALSAGDGVVVFADSHFSWNASWLEAVNAQTGKLIWKKAFLPQNDSSAPFLEANGLLYVSGSFSPQDDPPVGTLTALDIHTGAIRWSNKAGETTSLIRQGILYGFNALGEISAYDASDGQFLWRVQLQMPRETLGDSARLHMLNNKLYVGTESIGSDNHAIFRLHAFNLRTRKEDWYATITGTGVSAGSTISVAV